MQTNPTEIKSRPVLRPLAFILTLAVALQARAQGANPAPETSGEVLKLDPIVTVGSRFNQRTVADSTVPIDILTEKEIRQGGYTETAKVLQSQIPSFNNPHPTTPDGNTHIRSATLRGLSPDQTLVLVNGKRRYTSAWVNTGGTIGRGAVSTDLNAIPTTAIGSIEVLRDGASAQYGSDAIAGVINLILRRDLGTSASGTYGVTKEGDGDVWEGLDRIRPSAGRRRIHSHDALLPRPQTPPTGRCPTRASSTLAQIPPPARLWPIPATTVRAPRTRRRVSTSTRSRRR